MHLVWLIILVVCVLIAVVGIQRLRTTTPSAPRWTRLSFGLLAAISSGIAILLVVRFSDHFWIEGDEDRLRELRFLACLGIPILTLALIVAAASWLARKGGSEANVARRRLICRAIGSAGALALLPLAWFYWQMQWPPPYPPPPPGEPNHYGRIAAICKELTADYRLWRQQDPLAAGEFDTSQVPGVTCHANGRVIAPPGGT